MSAFTAAPSGSVARPDRPNVNRRRSGGGDGGRVGVDVQQLAGRSSKRRARIGC